MLSSRGNAASSGAAAAAGTLSQRGGGASIALRFVPILAFFYFAIPFWQILDFVFLKGNPFYEVGEILELNV